MKTESCLCSEYTSSSREPARLNHQNTTGTTTRLDFSVAYHCTKKREKKTALPSQPTIFQTLQATPRNFPSCQIKLVSQSMIRSLDAPPPDLETRIWKISAHPPATIFTIS